MNHCNYIIRNGRNAGRYCKVRKATSIFRGKKYCRSHYKYLVKEAKECRKCNTVYKRPVELPPVGGEYAYPYNRSYNRSYNRTYDDHYDRNYDYDDNYEEPYDTDSDTDKQSQDKVEKTSTKYTMLLKPIYNYPNEDNEIIKVIVEDSISNISNDNATDDESYKVAFNGILSMIEQYMPQSLKEKGINVRNFSMAYNTFDPKGKILGGLAKKSGKASFMKLFEYSNAEAPVSNFLKVVLFSGVMSMMFNSKVPKGTPLLKPPPKQSSSVISTAKRAKPSKTKRAKPPSSVVSTSKTPKAPPLPKMSLDNFEKEFDL